MRRRRAYVVAIAFVIVSFVIADVAQTLRLCRPTFGYAEGCPGSAERWLTSYGKGGPQQLKCDDAILSRGLKGGSDEG
ncbi:unnamed protein product [Prorocentrum cordatum]|uniref:Cellulase n=1 Tax=Prorocentrum cordatum TaxID=2364126 RepID=A0ABN9P9D2_9DINO|nr:unnamed protein product [Polarella glacialis]